jgi:hypothetical protein
MARHPLAEILHALRLRMKQMSVRELEEALEFAQSRVEYYWGDEAPPQLRFTEDMPPAGPAGCNHPGCNYRRYPASRFCMYHAPSHDTFAAQLRRAKAREERAVQGVAATGT